MKLKRAVKLLQGKKFDMVEDFWSKLGGCVDARYTVTVVDPETLLNDIDIDLDTVTKEKDLRKKVVAGLYNIRDIGSDGVKQLS